VNNAASNVTRRGKPGQSTEASDVLQADQQGHGGLNIKIQEEDSALPDIRQGNLSGRPDIRCIPNIL
jgi:hypothetical protein